MNKAEMRLAWKRSLTATLLLSLTVFVIWATLAAHTDTVSPAEARAASAPMPDLGDETAFLPTGDHVAGNGIIEPLGREANLAPDTTGRIAEIPVSEGQRVAQGDVLLRMDDAAARAALRTADAEVAVRAARLTRENRGMRREDIEALEADTDAARAREALATRSYDRVELLVRKVASSDDELDRARSERDASRAALEAAEARRRSAAKGARVEDISVAKAELAAAEAKRDEARDVLERHTLRAAWPGTILQIKQRVGERLTLENADVVVMGDTSRLVARIDIDERDLAKVAVGAVAFVVVPAQPGRRVPGTVVDLGHRMGRKNVRTDDPVERIDTKVIEAVVRLDEQAGLVPGLRVVGYVSTNRP